MDDEIAVRDVVSNCLELSGYSVDCVPDGAEALDLYAKGLRANRPYSAVILDLTVGGGLGGVEVLRCLQEIDVDVRAIIASGYSNSPVLKDYVEYGFSASLSKPFTKSQLIKAVEAAILAAEVSASPDRGVPEKADK